MIKKLSKYRNHLYNNLSACCEVELPTYGVINLTITFSGGVEPEDKGDYDTPGVPAIPWVDTYHLIEDEDNGYTFVQSSIPDEVWQLIQDSCELALLEKYDKDREL